MENEHDITTFSVENNKKAAILSQRVLCLETDGFAVISDLNDLSNNIYTLMGIKIQESDDVPNKICKSCYKIIVDFVDLTSKATRNEIYLRTLFGDKCKKDESTVDSTNNIDEIEDLISNDCSDNSNVTFLAVRKDLYESSTSIKEEIKTQDIRSQAHSEIELKCNICFKVFNSRKKHMLHQRSHNKNFSCPINICGKKFATKGDLEKHIRSHTGERPFQCDECKKSFTQRVSLRAHKISIHNMAT